MSNSRRLRRRRGRRAPDGTRLAVDQFVAFGVDGMAADEWAIYALTIPCDECGKPVRSIVRRCECGTVSPWDDDDDVEA